MAYLSVFNVPAGLDDFEPVHVPDGLAGLRNCCTDCVLYARFGRTDDFNYFVNVVFHLVSPFFFEFIDAIFGQTFN